MTVYARSDVASVSISQRHGGCGETHSRPVFDGAPVKEWALSCGPCENHLRHDTHLWATFSTSIPETPDEITRREEQEKRGMRDQASATAQALDNMGAMPEAFRQLAQALLNQQNQNAPLDTPRTLCINGHLVSGTKFCPECGTSMMAIETLNDTEPVSPSAAFAAAGQAAVAGFAAGVASSQAPEGSPAPSEDASGPTAPVRRRRVATT